MEIWSLRKHRRSPVSLQNLHIRQKAAEPDGTVSAAESEDIADFLTTFFTLYPTATEKELSYYVSGGFHAAGKVRGLYVQPA